MPLQLLPATAQAFAARSAPTIVLNTKPEQWLTQTLKRINKIRRPLNSVQQHFKCLTETLGGESAIWHLASLMLPKAPDTDLRRDSNPLVEALYNYQLLHLEAYVVHVDMVSQHEVAFKLTSETIDALVEYHKEIYLVDVAANSPSWPEKEAQVKKMQEEFVQAANRFVFRTNVKALEGLDDDGSGAGELLDDRPEKVKTSVTNMFQQLLPPPPRIVDVIHPAPILPHPHHQHMMAQAHQAHHQGWWTPASSSSSLHASLQAPHPLPAPVDSWKVLLSTPSPTATSCSNSDSHQPSSTTSLWQDMSSLAAMQLPSPTPSFSQPHHSSSFSAAPPTSAGYYSSPECLTPLPAAMTLSSSGHCGSDMGMGMAGGYQDFSGWSQAGFASQFATAV